MATKFSPCKGSYVLNQFPSNVMFGMNGFHVSASGAIQGHHGPLVLVAMATRVMTGIQSLEQLKEFADDNFKFDENERKLSKLVENTVGKGEIEDLYCRHVKTRDCLGKG